MGGRYFTAIGTIVGTIVGAGILALPYAISQAGFIIGVALILLIGLASILITMYTGELSFKLKKIHQLPVLISRLKHPKVRATVLALQILILDGAILAYLIAMGASLQGILGIPYWLSVLLVFALAAPIVYKGYMAVEEAESTLSAIKIFLILLVSIVVILSLKIGNLTTINTGNILEPFGVILFALMAFTVVPEIREELDNKPRDFNKAIIIGTTIAMAVYIFFSAAFIGAFGPGVAAIATNSLGSGSYSILFYILTIFLVITPYIALSLVIIDSLNFDFSVKRNYSFWITVLIPLALALIGFNFAHVLEVIGGILLPILSLMILISVYDERKRFTKISYKVPGGTPLLVFTAMIMLAGFIYTLFYLVL